MARLFGTELSRAQTARHTGGHDQLYGVSLVEHIDGPERGVRVLRFRTGSGLAFEVLPDRGMDIAGLELHGLPIGWRSPTGFRSPWLHEHDAEDGLGWLRSFSGLVNTCGLDHIMGPEAESAEHFAYPYRKRVSHGLHGRVAYTPARLVGYGVRWRGEQGILWAEGEVRQAAMFGENLVLRRRIEAEVGGGTVTQTDSVTNEAFHPTPHGLLYHVNFGWPVVAEGTRLVAPIAATPFTAHDPKATAIGPLIQAGPQSGFREQVYEHRVRSDAHGIGFAALLNPAQALPGGGAGLGCVVEWDNRAMPALYQWQNLQEGNYVVGLEPATAHAGSRAERRAQGGIVDLEPGGERRYLLRLTPVAGAEALAEVERHAAA
ncbi:MAG TPA: aldose 1-epimerase family protein [Geminicoccaceae bacterium]|mgnify:CR=1 FL=1|nr:aldose 1-epimerase family protein [Geminicoccus sp.]HMU49117.1 aldose 1-epimerase family protein [Geminicoccaceae bacterium]